MLGLLVVFWVTTLVALGASLWQTRELGRNYQSFQHMYCSNIKTDPKLYYRAAQDALPWLQYEARHPMLLTVFYVSDMALCSVVYVSNFGVMLTSTQNVLIGLVFFFAMITPGIITIAFLVKNHRKVNDENARFKFNIEAAKQLVQVSRY